MKPVLTLIFHNISIFFITMREKDNEGVRRKRKKEERK